MLRVTVAAAFAWACVAASAQTPNPVIQHYRAYQAALEANDLATAEREAAAALAASEARDGDGGHTGVLAMNLAQIRVDDNRGAEALNPARRAHDIASSRGPASGVDPLMAELALARAELATRGLQAFGARRLTALLETLDSQTQPEVTSYDAVAALAEYAANNRDWELAQRSYASAVRIAEINGLPPLERARAHTGLAAAVVSGATDGLNERLPLQLAQIGAASVSTALRLLEREATAVPWGDSPEVQQAYAAAMAWRFAIEAIALFDHGRGGVDALGLADVPLEAGRAAAPTPICPISIVSRDLASIHEATGTHSGSTSAVPAGATGGFSYSGARRIDVVAVVMMLQVSEVGEVIDSSVVASIGDQVAGRRLARAAQRAGWRVVRTGNVSSECRLAMWAFWPHVQPPLTRRRPG